jgi:O-antigen ligase
MSLGALGITDLLLARYGIGGILQPNKIWRPLLALALLVVCLFGGYRSMAINLLLTAAILFYLEGLLRSRFLPVIVLGFVLTAAVLVPFASKFPLSVQRSLAFLPIPLDPQAEENAKGSSEWRKEIWMEALPLVPKYLVLGKGYAINIRELDQLGNSRGFGATPAENAAGAAIAGDYHNGPLSVVIPFGILGVVGFVWFLAAGGKAMYRNYKFGDPALQKINRFLLAFYCMKIIMFVTVFGSLYSDFVGFTGLVGLSVALNGGMRSAVAEAPRPVLNKLRLIAVPR